MNTKPKSLLEQCAELAQMSEKATVGPWIETCDPNDDSAVYDWYFGVKQLHGDDILGVCSLNLYAKSNEELDATSKFIAASRSFVPSVAEALPKIAEALGHANSALQGFEMHVGGRIPHDSSDSMRIEAIHAMRLAALLQPIHEALALLNRKAKP